MQADPSLEEPASLRVAVVGGGFSGLCLAAHLHRATNRRVQVVVIERGTVGDGLAFSTREAAHLLNGPAGNQSAFDDAPNDFVDFLSADPEAAPFLDRTRPIQGQFVPRMLYARYLRRLAARLLEPAPAGSTVRFVRGEVVR
ncbi:FAD/NAD(P)-binding protein, partial [Ramlibacter sp.]|uniref:FAD/NAD(P)-binding protein n=1 Tax=Ramlibacter sp. TaxID=1917967 RepID=UPI0017B2AABF